MNEITLTLGELGQLIIFLFVAAICVLAVIVLVNINKTVGKIRNIIDKNEQNIEKSFSAIPALVENISETSEAIKDNVGKLGSTVDSITSAVSETAAVVSDKSESFFDIVSVVAEIIKTLLAAFSKDK